MATSAFVKRGPQKALLPKKPASISTAPTKRWVKKFKHSECKFDAYNDGIGDELGKLRYRQVMTGAKGSMGPVKPPPGMTKEFIAGLPTVKTLGATAVLSAVMLSEDLSKFKVYFSKPESNSTNVTAASTKKPRVKRFAQADFANSGGSRLLDYIRKFLQFRSGFSNESTLDDPSTEVIQHTKRPQEKSVKIHSLTNCVAMNSANSFYECYQSSAKVLLFSNNPEHDPKSSPTSIDHCVPLHWNGQPSVGCHGQQFGFIYTPYETSGQFFSFLDGWLMLARVGLQVVENFKKGEEKSEIVCFDSDDFEYCNEQLEEIEKILMENDERKFKWAKLQLEEMKTDVKEFSLAGRIKKLDKIIWDEKLTALKQDLLEEIKYNSDMQFVGSVFQNLNLLDKSIGV